MKTILAARENIAQLWGHPQPKDTTYRMMKYLLQTEVEEGILLHNNVTGHLVLLSQEEAELIVRLPLKPTEPIMELIANHFLVPEDYDEYRSVNQLRRIYQRRTTGEAINHYVILPTTFCNAHCFYCYESDYPRVHMTEETANKLIDFINEQRKGKTVSISWFGGEPLVGIKRIDQISQGLKDRGIQFTSNMISNGYLFDETIVEKAVNLWKLSDIQITLDGTENVYNRTKAYVNATENPYQRILRNIDLLSSHNVRVTIRLNLDFYNKDDIRALIEELGTRYSGNKSVTVYLNKLFNHQGYEPVDHSTDESIMLLNVIDEYTGRLIELKLAKERGRIPSLAYTQCMADDNHTVEIQPDGGFCRCEHESLLDSYGSIEKGILDPQKPLRWKENVERSAYCSDCAVYPACYVLRGCMNSDDPCVESLRMRAIEAYKEQLRSVYHNSLEGKRNEKV